MKHVKAFALLTAFLLVLTLSACKSDGDAVTTIPSSETEETWYLPDEATSSLLQPEESTAEEITSAEITTVPATELVTEEVTAAVIETTTEQIIEVTTAPSEDVSSWNTAKAVAFYIDAAEKTGASVNSEQVMKLADISVNNGQLRGVFNYVTPLLSSFISGKATVTSGITGEYKRLCENDIKAYNVYEAGNGTVIEFTLNNQTDNAASMSEDGSVGHGISVVGDLMSVMGQLREAGLPLDISEEKTVLTYTEPEIKVLIDKNGEIVNGTWSYTVEVSLSDYRFAGAKVDSTKVVLENTITVNGGFGA